MAGIPEQEIAKYRCILMYDDETIIDAATALRDAPQGYDWWHLVADLAGGGYAVARFSDLAAQVKTVDGTKRAAFLNQPLSGLVGTMLAKVDVVIDQDQASLDSTRERASRTHSGVAIILKDGHFKGIIATGGTRSGPMDVGLVSLVGNYATLPEKGLMSKRRRQALEAKNRK